MAKTGGSWKRDHRLEAAFFAHEHKYPGHGTLLSYSYVRCIDCDYRAEIINGELVETKENDHGYCP